VRIPRLGVVAAVLPVATRGEVLVPPSDPAELGWWAEGARPGDPGRALVAGHTVNAGGGALDDLETLKRGDRVTVGSRGGSTRWVVESVEVLGKGEIALRAEQLFTQEGPSRLVLLTCEDWDGTRYLSNVVVTALPVDPEASPTAGPTPDSGAVDG
jgi:LPXTG-site transpeptidase (sortase) family protein